MRKLADMPATGRVELTMREFFTIGREIQKQRVATETACGGCVEQRPSRYLKAAHCSFYGGRCEDCAGEWTEESDTRSALQSAEVSE